MKRYYFIIPIIFFIADRIIKYFASSISIGGGFVKIGLYKNFAGAFSLPISGMIYNIIGIILLLVFIFLFFHTTNRLKKIAYALIIFGGVSNIFDRLFFGYVIDYIQIIGRSFFNLADVMLVIGVAILLVHQIKIKGSKHKQTPNANN